VESLDLTEPLDLSVPLGRARVLEIRHEPRRLKEILKSQGSSTFAA
jgi:hypothetical protein